MKNNKRRKSQTKFTNGNKSGKEKKRQKKTNKTKQRQMINDKVVYYPPLLHHLDFVLKV